MVLKIHRTAHSLLDPAGQVLINGADDVVTARGAKPAGRGRNWHWREWNFQLDSSVATIS